MASASNPIKARKARAKPATKSLKKLHWDEHKETILAHYETSILQEVMQIMEEVHGFVANKRQYVYRLNVWGATKYKSSSPGDGSATPNSPEGIRTAHIDGISAQRSPNPGSAATPACFNDHPAPGRKWSQVEHYDGYCTAWLVKQKLRIDILAVVPGNTNIFPKYYELLNYLHPEQRDSLHRRALVDACVFSAQPDQTDVARQVLNDPEVIPPTSPEGKLRRRLHLHALGPQSQEETNIMNKVIRFINNRPSSADLNMFILLMLFTAKYSSDDGLDQTNSGSGNAQIVPKQENVLTSYVSALQADQAACDILREGIKWCLATCSGPPQNTPILSVHCSSPEEWLQVAIATVSCHLSAQLLSEQEAQPPAWARDIEARLGISRITFAIVLVRMAWTYSQVRLSPEVRFPTPFHMVCHGSYEMTLADPSTLWRPFLDAFIEANNMVLMNQPNTFSTSSPGHLPGGEKFISDLDGQVQDFILTIMPAELSETESDPGLATSWQNSPMIPPLPVGAFPSSSQDQDVSMVDGGEFNRAMLDETLAGADPFEGGQDCAAVTQPASFLPDLQLDLFPTATWYSDSQ